MPVSKPTKSSQTPSGPQWMHAERTNLWTLSIGGFFFSLFIMWRISGILCKYVMCFPIYVASECIFPPPIFIPLCFYLKKKQLNKRQIAIAIMFKKCNENTEKNNNKKHNKTRIFKSNSNRSSCVMR